MKDLDLNKLAALIGPIGVVVVVLFWFEYQSDDSDESVEFQQLVMERLKAVEDTNEECLAENQKLLRELSILKTNLIIMQASTDSAPFAAWMKDMQGNMVFINAEYEAKFLICRGYTKEDYIGKPDHAVWPKEIADSFRANDQIVIDTGRMFDFHEDIETCDGGLVPLRFVKWPSYAGSRMVGTNGMYIPEATL